MVNQGRGRGQGNRAAGFQRPVAGRARRRAGTSSDSIFVPNNNLPSGFVIDIVGPNFVRSLTVHRPIGCLPATMDREQDWVISDSASVEQLLAGSDDPNQPVIEANRAAARLRLALAETSPVLLQEVNGVYVFPTSKSERAPLVKAARKAFRAEAKRTGHNPPDGYASFLPERSDRDEEVALENFYRLPSTKAAVLSLVPDSGYVTRSGPLQDQDQVACIEYRSLDARLLQNRIYRDIASMGRRVALPHPTTRQP